MARDALYILPHGIESLDPAGVQKGGYPVALLAGAVERLAQRGRVLLMLDCCHAGAAHHAAPWGLDARSLRAALALDHVTVLTGCAAQEVAVESPDWSNGAFTEAALGALSQGGRDGDGMIGLSDLIHAVEGRLSALTEGRRTLGKEDRITGAMLVATGV